MKAISKFVLSLYFLIMFIGCSEETPVVSAPREISGKITNGIGEPIKNVNVSIPSAPDAGSVFSDEYGNYSFRDLNVTLPLTIRFVHPLYKPIEKSVPSPDKGISKLNVEMEPGESVPYVKPLSTGPVRINAKKLEVDFDGNGVYEDFIIHGAAYSPTPIGRAPFTQQQQDRSIQYLVELNANTIRTYSGADPALLTQCAANGIRVIVGFWVNFGDDLSSSVVRQAIKDQFSQLVYSLKDNPGLLMWTLGNEQNYGNGNSALWYTLVQELSILAYQIEGAGYHPVCANNGWLFNIGNSSKSADDASLSYMDCWAANAYAPQFTSFFQEVRIVTQKPIVLTEWGIDALDNRTKLEYQEVQAERDSLLWTNIYAARDICLGGTVFEYTDEWWKAEEGNTQDFGGYPTDAHPDGFSNEEWWGIIKVTPDSNGDGMDDWQPRLAFYTLQRLWDGL